MLTFNYFSFSFFISACNTYFDGKNAMSSKYLEVKVCCLKIVSDFSISLLIYGTLRIGSLKISKFCWKS